MAALTFVVRPQYNRPVRRIFLVILFLPLTNILPGCGKEDSGSDAGLKNHNVLLITLDTTRADRLGCYGYGAAKTPALDAVGARGALFEDAVSPVPLTLPSHCAIMTGRFPKEFGVRNNNQAALGATHPTLASIFKGHSYRTAAFVASFVLDSRFGLHRGFDVYEDEMGNVSMKSQPFDWEQPANAITDRALNWLGADDSKPFFAWLHFYDPHDPYTPPPAYPKTYDGEIAFMDTQIKRVMDWLDQSGQRDRTLVIVVGDHGESFGEHGEEGHGMFLYHTSLHVPLIFSHPALTAKPTRIANTVGIVDIFPTLLDLFGWPKPQGLQSVSLTDAIRSGTASSAEVFSESDYVWYSYGWAQQRSFTTPEWKFISSTRCELYDRKKDPLEKDNLCRIGNDTAVELSNKLGDFYGKLVAVEAAKLLPSAKADAALSGLGYVGGLLHKDEFLTPGAADPKDMLDVVKNFKTARQFIKHEKYVEAADLLKIAGEQAPNSLAIHAAHGMALNNAHRHEEALVALDKALKLDAQHQPAIVSVGDARFDLGQFDEALKAFSDAGKNDPLDPTAQYKLGRTLLRLKRPDEARVHFVEALKIFPDFPEAQFEMGTLLADANQYSQAIEHFQASVKLKPDGQEAQYNLGRALLVTKKFGPAVEHLREASRLNPQHGASWVNLGIALLSSGKTEEGQQALERATQIPDSAVEAHLNLAILARKLNDRAAEKQHYEDVLRLDPKNVEATRQLQRLQSQP